MPALVLAEVILTVGDTGAIIKVSARELMLSRKHGEEYIQISMELWQTMVLLPR